MANVALNLLVLKTRQVDRLLAFYQTLGIEFTEEQHGKGPRHYSGQVGPAVIEIYPLPEGGVVDTSSRLGFSVGNLAEVVQRLHDNSMLVIKQLSQTAWGFQAVAKDPDGRTVELTQQ